MSYFAIMNTGVYLAIKFSLSLAFFFFYKIWVIYILPNWYFLQRSKLGIIPMFYIVWITNGIYIIYSLKILQIIKNDIALVSNSTLVTQYLRNEL